ncbi:MAG TPA: polysaccharide deacetylase family protein [Gammaproteobacteria bacterium]|nr:polysaccharide deacetylase family protein [Gammaproteobacteria bacterium]
MTPKMLIRQFLGPLLLPGIAVRNYLLPPYAIILLYHSISNERNTIDPVSIAVFNSHMHYLSKYFSVISLEQLQSSLYSQIPSQERSFQKPFVVITFDDGYLDNFTNALPVLDHYNFKATFFLATSAIGCGIDKRLQNKYGLKIPMMDWDHIKSLLHRGHSIGSHTSTHRTISELATDQKIREFTISQQIIFSNTGLLTKLFSFPFGDKHSYRPIDYQLASNYYDICCNNIRGKNIKGQINLLDLHRYAINGAMSFNEFKMELRGCYDVIERFRP